MSKYNPPFCNLKESAKGLFPLSLTLACAITLLALESVQFKQIQVKVLPVIDEDPFFIEQELTMDFSFHEDLVKKKIKKATQIVASNEQVRNTFEMTPISKVTDKSGSTLLKRNSANLGLDINISKDKIKGLSDLNLDNYPYFKSCYNPNDVIEQFKCTKQKLERIISQNTVYPEIDYLTRTEGTVVLAFTINRFGQVSDIQVSRSATNTLNKAAIRSLNRVPDFVPGTQNGRAINVRFHVPITFKIDKNY